MTKTRSHLHMFQRIFKSTKFTLYLYILIFIIEQDIWVTRSNEFLNLAASREGYQLVSEQSHFLNAKKSRLI
jgi:hypothetical protein